jgi:hypothetical protein
MIQKQLEKVIIGATLAAAASVLVPIFKSTLPPLIRAGREGVEELAERTRGSISYVREEIEDIVAEAQFERMQKKFEREIASNDH